MRGQRVPVRHEKEALIFFLELQPILKRTEIMAKVQTARRPHAA
jgi:hypothetical protein